jgi:hypothetical protein
MAFCLSGGNQAGYLPSLRENDCEDIWLDSPNHHPTFFLAIIRSVGHFYSRKVAEDSGSLGKRNTVLAEIGFGFRGIPFEFHTLTLSHLQPQS